MSVEVKLELGHRAALRDKPTTEGFTHDWTVFVRGSEGSNISHFVDKVVFYLHESFPKPKRVVKEPPYQVMECGYAGFMMPIEVFFRNKEEPKKVCFEYDLYLRVGGEPVYNIRVEKLTFQNPSEDFRRKLLKARSDRTPVAGAVGLPTSAVAPLQRSEESRPTTYTKPVAAIAEKKPKSHSAIKEPSKPIPPAPKPSQPFNEIFGSPIKPKHSPEPSNKSKENVHSSHQKQNKYLPPTSTIAAVVASKDPKQTVKETQSIETKEVKPKAPKTEKEAKIGTKRSHVVVDGQNQQQPEKKRKHAGSSGSNVKASDGTKIKEEKKEKHKSKLNAPGKKEKHRNSVLQHKDLPKSPKLSNSHKLSDSLSSNSDSNDVKGAGVGRDDTVGHHNASVISPNTPDESFGSVSPVSRDIDNDLISPLSSDDESLSHPPHLKEKPQAIHHSAESGHRFQNDSCTKTDSLKAKSNGKTKLLNKHKGKQNGTTSNHDSSLCEKPSMSVDTGYHQELVDLQKKIMSLNDQHQLQRIVDVIEKTGKFHISNRSFDFDLCSLDQNTVRQLKGCLS